MQLGNIQLGATPTATYLATLPTSTPNSYRLLVGCDQKSIIRRNGYNNYSVIFAPRPDNNMEPMSFPITQLNVAPCSDTSPSRITAAERASNTPWIYGNCTEDHFHTSIINPPSSATPPVDSTSGYESDPRLTSWEGLGANSDDQGRQYVVCVYHTATLTSGPHGALVRSTDYTQSTWETLFALGPTSGLAIPFGEQPVDVQCIFAKGYMWYISVGNVTNAGTRLNALFRIDLTTPAVTHFTIPWSSADIDDSKFNVLNNFAQPYTLNYTPDNDIMWGHALYGVFRLSDNAFKSAPIMKIDITNPDVPIITFGPFEPLGVSINVSHIQSFDNDIHVLKAFHTTPENVVRSAGNHWDKGGIWKTTDGGATWINTKPLHRKLAAALRSDTFISVSAYDGTGEAVQTVAIANNTEVFVMGAPPYIYHSVDQGDTWIEEYVDPAIWTPFIGGARDEPANQFDSSAICFFCIFPGAPANYIIVTLIG